MKATNPIRVLTYTNIATPKPQAATSMMARLTQLRAVESGSAPVIAAAPVDKPRRIEIVSDSTVWTPPQGDDATPAVEPQLPQEVVDAVMDALRAPLQPGATAQMANAVKEQAIGMLLDQLTVSDSRWLRKRLIRKDPSDALSKEFALLMHERQQRLLQFLADAPRRDAIRRAKRAR
jgi:hypothetical protein